MKKGEPEYRYKNVMLIDDSELDNFINQKMMEAHDFARNIYVHTSARSGLEFLQNLVTMGSEHENVIPEVIFVDINMPIMDGFQFIEQFKKTTERNLKKPKLVILTSSVYHEDRQKALLIGKDIVFLNKPLTVEVLHTL